MMRLLNKILAYSLCIHMVVCMLFFDGIMFHHPFYWKLVTLDQDIEVYLPKSWILKENNDCYYVENHLGKIMMYEVILGANENDAVVPSCISKISDIEVQNYQIFQSGNIIGTLSCRVNDIDTKKFYIQFVGSDYKCLFVIEAEEAQRLLFQMAHMQNDAVIRY